MPCIGGEAAATTLRRFNAPGRESQCPRWDRSAWGSPPWVCLRLNIHRSEHVSSWISHPDECSMAEAASPRRAACGEQYTSASASSSDS